MASMSNDRKHNQKLTLRVEICEGELVLLKIPRKDLTKALDEMNDWIEMHTGKRP